MFATLGNIQFDVLTGFTGFEKKEATVYAVHEVIESKGRLQLTAEELDEIGITVHFHAAFCKPSEMLSQLRAARIAGDILPLTWGNGTYEGQYVVKEIDTKYIQQNELGSVISLEAALVLTEFFDSNPAATQSNAAKSNAFATSPAGVSRTSVPGAGATTPAGDLTAGLKDTQSATAGINKDVSAMQNDTTKMQQLSKRISDNLNKAEIGLNKMKDALDKAFTLKTDAAGLYQQVQTGLTTVANFKNKLPITNLLDALTGAQNLTSATGQIKSGASPICALMATRYETERTES